MGQNLSDKVKPNMKAVNTWATLRIVIAFLIFLVMAVIFGMYIADATRDGNATLFCFFGGIISLVSAIVFIAKRKKIRQIVTLMKEIKSMDKIRMESLSLSQHTTRAQVMMIIKKLIETGNLSEYELIGEVGVAKTALQARESDFVSGLAVTHKNDPAAAAKNECPNCGAAVTKDNNGKFCKYCGAQLP